MDTDSGEPDAAALRDRVAQLEQTVADQQATIESLSPPTASRRGVLAALTGVAGAGALGAYSQRGAAQAAGQIGTSAEPVEVEAWDLTVQNQLAGDLDAGGNSLTNVEAVETDALEADTTTIKQVAARGELTTDQSIPDNTFTQVEIDQTDIEDSSIFTVDEPNNTIKITKDGKYNLKGAITYETSPDLSSGDQLLLQIRNVTDNVTRSQTIFGHAAGSENQTLKTECVVSVSANTEFIMRTRHRSGSAQTLVAGGFRNQFEALRIS